MNHIFFIHSSVDGHLGCFRVLAVVHSAAVNIGVYVSLQIRVKLTYVNAFMFTKEDDLQPRIFAKARFDQV